jgi:chorismate mutase / prephenate dehydratase
MAMVPVTQVSRRPDDRTMKPIPIRHAPLLDPFDLPERPASLAIAAPDDDDDSLADLRARVDDVDERIRSLLHTRATMALRIGELKRARGEPVLAATREHEVIGRVRLDDDGAMPALVLEDLFRVVVDACRRLQARPRVGCLGPAGSFSHVAARMRFGATAQVVPLPSMTAVVEAAAKGDVDIGVVPVEARGGRVDETHTAVAQRAAHVRVTSEFRVPVIHQLLGKGTLDGIVEVRSRPEVFRACTAWLADRCPHARLVATPSTSAAVREVATATTPGLAAIGSALAGRIYDVPVIARIGDAGGDAHTTFWLVRSVRADAEI